MERQTRNIRFRSNKRQNLIITSFSSRLGRWIIQQVPYKRQRRANPSEDSYSISEKIRKRTHHCQEQTPS
jgi:hypothetical protein